MLNANLLRGKIAEKGYTQEKLAEEMGVSKNTFSAKIRGYTDFTLSEVSKICSILGIVDYDEICRIFLS